MKNLLPLMMMLSLILGCSPSPSPIEYGSDMCNYCRMSIVDRQHSAEAVSQKGKVFKFDAIECMVHFLAENSQREYPIKLVSDYMSNGDLIDAQNAIYLISKEIPSPMGAFLSGFKDEDIAIQLQKEKGGKIYAWDEIAENLKLIISSSSTLNAAF